MGVYSEPCCLDYKSLDGENGKLLDSIEQAFGVYGLGFLVVKNVPGYVEAREKLLRLIREFALLPEEVKAKYERADLNYQFGWSHGKEVLVNGKMDTAKGSYYLNPFDGSSTKLDPLLSAENNVWPNDVVQGFEQATKEMSNIMKETALKLAKICDQYLVGKGLDDATRLSEVIEKSMSAKGRLLYYFPQKQVKEDAENSWCGIHCDHGSITCLTKALYFNERTGEEVTNSVSDGLEISASDGTVVSVQIPADCIAFQIGQAAQIHSGSLLRATPHAVSFPKVVDVSRCTYALFLQPDSATVLNVPHQIPSPSLPIQFEAGMDFGQFTAATIHMTHKHSPSKL